MKPIRLLFLLFISFNFIVAKGISQVRPQAKQTNASDSVPTTYQSLQPKNSYERYVENYVLAKLDLSTVLDIYESIFRKICSQEYKNVAHPYQIPSIGLKNQYNIEEIKIFLIEQLSSTDTPKDSIEVVKSFLNQFDKADKIIADSMYQLILSKMNVGTYYPERVAAYTLVRMYLDRISSMNQSINHTRLVLDLLYGYNLGSSGKQNLLLVNTIAKKTELVIKHQFLNLIYDFWKLKAKAGDSYNYDTYVRYLIASMYYLDRLRNDHPDFKTNLEWISKNYIDFKYYSSDIFNALPSRPDWKEETGLLIQFAWLNILSANGIKAVWDNNEGENLYGDRSIDKVIRPISIENYKKRLLQKVPTKELRLSVQTLTQNNCLKAYELNFTFDLKPQVLFQEYLLEPRQKIEKKLIFQESQGTVTAQQLSSEVTEKAPAMRVNPRGKFASSDILFYYLFQRNGNKNGSYLINAFNEVSDSIKVNNLNSIKESVLSAMRWSDDKFWNDQMQHHLYQMSLASYDTILLNKTNNPNNAKIINYLLFLEKEGSKSKDTLTQALTGHLDSIVKRSIMTKAPELIKKDLISYVEGVCMSQVKKSMKESVYFTGEAHHSSYNSSPGAAKLSFYPDGTASLNLTIFFNGEAMYKHLDGKVVKTSNGLYQFVSRESAFSFRYDVDQCGKKTLELAGLAQNSTIKALFTIQ